MHRDGQLLKKLTPEQRTETQKKLAELLINESRKITNEKFIKVIPEYDVVVASIIEDINNICKNYTDKLNLFGKNLIY